MGIARELNREGITSADVHLAVGLPLTWVNRQREDFRKYMLQHESVDFKYEDKLYSVRIVGCSVFPQGYAAVVPYLKDITGLNMLTDIGNRRCSRCLPAIMCYHSFLSILQLAADNQ